MKHLPVYITAIILAVAASYISVQVFMPEGETVREQEESVYDRVMRTGTIRCGYATWNPSLMKDPNTGEFSGIIYEYSEALGKTLNLDIEWVEEIPWSEFPAALEAKRVDVMCAGVWPSANRSRIIDYSNPVYYVPFLPYGRIDDFRFDQNLKKLNNPDYTLTMTDGETSSIIAHQDFPNTKKVELPQLTNISQNFLNVVNKRADVYLNDLTSFYDFNENNPDLLRIIPTDRPIRLFGVVVAIPREEEGLRRMINNATAELHQSGVVEKILRKYEKYPGSLYRTAKPYQPYEVPN